MAGFNTAVTGLKAATALLDVTGNNIANSSTVGFKSSRTEFGDIYATAVVGAGSSNTPGSGVTVTDIAQDFSGGTIEFTNSNLDLAINGSGFFQLNDGQGNITYTRAGSFELDKEGNIVSKNGKYLQGFGLSPLGTRLPIQNLGVTEKTSQPKATERIGLSFNIDENENAADLSKTFNKTDANSYTYSTTVATFDSLGNEQSIRFYFREQGPDREEHSYAGVVGVDAVTSELDFTGTPSLSGFILKDADDISATTEAAETDTNKYLYFDTTGYLTEYSQQKLAGEISSVTGDPRIDASTVKLDAAGALTFEVNAEYTDYGNYVVSKADGSEATAVINKRSASEVQSLTLNKDATVTGALPDDASYTPESDPDRYFSNPDQALTRDITVTIGGVEITIKKPTEVGVSKTLAQVGAEIASYEQDIMDRNPDVEAVDFENGQIKITWKPEAGDVSPISVSGANGQDNKGVFATVETSPGVFVPKVVELEKGDNSFIGSYRTYAFLNDTDQLDLGKTLDPGETSPENKKTEVGPILINFNSTTGVLEMVNGEEVGSTGKAPLITILGANPANREDEILENDVDKLAGIQLDISGSSQFGSESVDNSQSQDGYTKGDLIGVSFAETGEMVASYSNGQRANLGLVAIATFENQDGLQPSGNTEWIATLASGNALLNRPGTGLNGTLRSAALEQSNVDLSAELVKLIEGQRNFQANSKTLETLNTVTQAILQI